MKYFALIAVLVAGFQTSYGQYCDPVKDKTCPNAILTAVPFLRIVPDARHAALGDAGIATSADANSIHHNASRLAFIDSDMGLSVSYSPWLRALGLQDVYLAYLAGYKRIGENQ